MQSRAFKILLPIALVFLALAVTVVMIKTRPQAKRQTPSAPQPKVTVFTIGELGTPVQIHGFGSVKAKRSVTIVPQVSGEVTTKSKVFETGGYFTQGQLLLKIDDIDYRLAVARAEADVAQAEVNLAMAEEESQVARDEWATIGSRNVDGSGQASEPSSLVLREPQLKLARTGLEAAKAALLQAKVNLGRCSITAPFDGRVLSADTDAGQYLRAGTAIGSIYATDIAEITISVPDEDLAWLVVDPDDRQASTVTVTAEFGGASHTWDGRAVRLGGAVDARSRLVPVVVEVDHPYERVDDRPPLVEGMFVKVQFLGEPPAGAVAIPRTALRPNNVVWVVDQTNKMQIREVRVLRAGVKEALIADGLAPGDRVCTSNLQFVTDGMPVRIEGVEIKDGDR